MPEPIAASWRWCRRHQEAATAAVLTAASVVIVARAGLAGSPLGLGVSACVVAVSTLTGLRRRWPIAVAVAAGVLLAVPGFTRYGSAVNDGAAQYPESVAIFVVAYALGSASRWRRSLVGLAALVVGTALSVGNLGNPFVEMVTVGPWLAGLVVGSRRRAGHQLELRARELDEERELFAVQSVRYERARIARELHDIVAHAVTLMVVQASAGEHLAGADPSGAGEAFDSISEAARHADTEIDRLVRLLDASAPTAGATDLRIVEELVARVSASSPSISCRFGGDSDGLSTDAADAAYRLVQESVTNAIRYAPGAPIEVRIEGRGDAVDVEVVNSRPRERSSGLESVGGSRGLAGMRERVVGSGGVFDAGPTADGGWRVSASLPRSRAAVS